MGDDINSDAKAKQTIFKTRLFSFSGLFKVLFSIQDFILYPWKGALRKYFLKSGKRGKFSFPAMGMFLIISIVCKKLSDLKTTPCSVHSFPSTNPVRIPSEKKDAFSNKLLINQRKRLLVSPFDFSGIV